ncbi:MAG: hypothetical protein H6745_04605 [Deltaproteobacteria bacterium]|nr:hypothetical protein [Deltaproteobacteria bacterium]
MRSLAPRVLLAASAVLGLLLLVPACADEPATGDEPLVATIDVALEIELPVAIDGLPVGTVTLASKNGAAELRSVIFAPTGAPGVFAARASFPCEPGLSAPDSLVAVFDGFLPRAVAAGVTPALHGFGLPQPVEDGVACRRGKSTPVSLRLRASLPDDLPEPAGPGRLDIGLHGIGGAAKVGDIGVDLALLGDDGAPSWTRRQFVSELERAPIRRSVVGACPASGVATLAVAVLGAWPGEARAAAAESVYGGPAPREAYRVWEHEPSARAVDCAPGALGFADVGVVMGLRVAQPDGQDAIRVGPTTCTVAWRCAEAGDELPALDLTCFGEAAPRLAMDDLVVRCDDGAVLRVDPRADGELAVPEGSVAGTIRLRVPVDAADHARCRVVTRALVESPGEPDTDPPGTVEGVVPAGVIYPLIAVDLPVGAGVACEARHLGDEGLAVIYTDVGAPASTALAHRAP